MYNFFLHDLDLRLLKLLQELSPSLSEEEISLFALLLGCRSRGDTRLTLEKQNIITVFNTKIRPLIKKTVSDVEIENFLNQCIQAAEKIIEHPNPSIIGNSQSTSFPLILENNSLYIQKYFIAKETIQQKIKLLFPTVQKTYSAENTQENEGLHYLQAEAVNRGSFQNLVITGGPGTGKTTVVFYILKNLLSKNSETKIYLAAPSGKAAARMQESIRNSILKIKLPPEISSRLETIESKTIHRLLKFNPKTNSFSFNEKHPFPDGGIFVIDEASMIDIEMFAHLLRAIPTDSRVFLLGDENQLSSVEAGAVLGDLLIQLCSNSVVRLTYSFRSNNKILSLANDINQAPPLKLASPLIWDTSYTLPPNTETGIFAISTPKTTKNWSTLLDSWIQKHYEPYKEILSSLETSLEKKKFPLIVTEADSELIKQINQAWKTLSQARILCAERHGAQGTIEINKIIQSKCDSFSLLLITQNLYSHGLFNGDTGLVLRLRANPFVIFQQANHYEIISLSFLPKETYEEAFAMTIHKSQGSEFDHVMIVLPTKLQHLLLSKQILYTGITRAKMHCTIISEENVFKVAAEKKESRETGLI